MAKAYCINLDSRPEKWNATQEAFAGSGLKLQRFPGIVKSEGWRGCGASHMAIAHEAIRLGLPYVIVVEDDCVPVADFAERWPAVLEGLKADDGWDLFLGGPTNVQGPVEVRPPLIEIERGFATHFYVLKACAYERAIAWNPDRHGPIDVYYSDQFRIVTTHPGLATQRPSTSDILGKHVDYTWLFEQSGSQMDALIYSFYTREGTLILLGLSALLIFVLAR
jgi:hypothetical protein